MWHPSQQADGHQEFTRPGSADIIIIAPGCRSSPKGGRSPLRGTRAGLVERREDCARNLSFAV